MRALQGRLAEQNTVVGNDAYRHAFNVRKAAHQGCTKARLKFVQLRAVHDAGNNLAHIKGLSRIGGNDAIQLFSGKQRRLCCAQLSLRMLALMQMRHRLTRQRQRMQIVLRQVVSHARQAGVDIATAQVFRTHHFACGSFD